MAALRNSYWSRMAALRNSRRILGCSRWRSLHHRDTSSRHRFDEPSTRFQCIALIAVRRCYDSSESILLPRCPTFFENLFVFCRHVRRRLANFARSVRTVQVVNRLPLVTLIYAEDVTQRDIYIPLGSSIDGEALFLLTSSRSRTERTCLDRTDRFVQERTRLDHPKLGACLDHPNMLR